jgi:glycosyltransferase involved in cell wall biosynthesis
VLVNDGSTDGSERICLEYAERYPRNVVYEHQGNSGVSAARNNGLKHASGHYVTFLDSDDIWSEDAFEKVRDFFSEHEAERVDMVSCRISFFGAREGYHITDDKYKWDRIVDLREKAWTINTTIGNTFIRAEAIRGVTFDERLTVNEDVLFLAAVLIRNPVYGVLRSAVFKYRVRAGGEALTSIKDDSPRYFPQLLLLLDALRALAKQGENTAAFLAYTRAYFMLWAVRTKTNRSVLDHEEAGKYEPLLAEQLKDIGLDQIYRHHKRVHTSYKAYLYLLKYGKDILKSAQLQGSKLYYDGSLIYNFALPNRVVFRSIRREEGRYLLEGETDIIVAGAENTIRAMPPSQFSGSTDDDGYRVEVRYDQSFDRYVSLGKKVMDGVAVSVSLPEKNGAELMLTASYSGESVPLGFHVDGGIEKKNMRGTKYFEHGDCLIVYISAGAILFHNNFAGRWRLNKVEHEAKRT